MALSRNGSEGIMLDDFIIACCLDDPEFFNAIMDSLIFSLHRNISKFNLIGSWLQPAQVYQALGSMIIFWSPCQTDNLVESKIHLYQSKACS